MVSGYAEFEYAQIAMRKGADDYLLKPVNQKELYHALKKIKNKLEPSLKNAADRSESISVNQSFLGSILAEMRDHYTEDISLNELSDKYKISPGHLSMLIKKELGLSFSEYITAKRLQMAKELLLDENLSIEEVANAAGYHDYFYFTKVFKKAVGLSPSKYRKELT